MGRLNLLLLSLKLERLQRPSRELNARPRSLLLLKERIERTKTACLSWLQNFKERSRPTNNRSKRLRRLPLLILPSSVRLSKSLRRPRNVQSLLWSCKWQPVSSQDNLKDVIDSPPSSTGLKNTPFQNLLLICYQLAFYIFGINFTNLK